MPFRTSPRAQPRRALHAVRSLRLLVWAARLVAAVPFVQAAYLFTLTLAAPRVLRAPQPSVQLDFAPAAPGPLPAAGAAPLTTPVAAPAPEPERAPHHVIVLVPAHNEGAGVAATIRSIAAAQATSRASSQTIVIADNCTDDTEHHARAAGAAVWPRSDATLRGKGHALAWAIERLARDDRWTAILFVDADCTVSPGTIDRVAWHAERTGAVQFDYRVANAGASPTAARRAAGFLLINTVRPAGKESLGLSAGIFGSGMAFSRAVLDHTPWASSGLAEDAEQHLRLTSQGVRVAFDPSAEILSDMPETQQQGASQEARWEGGRWAVARYLAPAALRAGIAGRDRVQVAAALELFVLPQSLLGAAGIAAWTIGRLARDRPAARGAQAALALQGGHVVLGLLVARAPAAVWTSLAGAPVALLRKLGLAKRIGKGDTPTTFIRTERRAR